LPASTSRPLSRRDVCTPFATPFLESGTLWESCCQPEVANAGMVRHARPHLTRTVLEGVSFGLRDSLELMRNAGSSERKQVSLTEGGAKSPLWRRILADILGVEIVTLSSVEGAAYGAALLEATGQAYSQTSWLLAML
jgi:sugar (pentulose or hexulose) kinase